MLPPCASTIRTASSTAHSSCGLTVKPRWRVSIAEPSAVRTIRPPVAGTRLTQTRMFTSPDAGVLGIEQRRRAGDRDGHRVALAEVLDEELRARPSACAGGRYAISRCFPTDGPEPAEVTYERRPFASTIDSPSRVRIGSRPSM